MTNRIDSAFEGLRKRNEKALVTYFAAGDPFPTVEGTAAVVLALAEGGADIIELGIPYSDPVADAGSTIQAASQRALDAGVNPVFVFDVVREVRKTSQVPIVLMGYYNSVFRTGIERFSNWMAEVGADGVILSDLPPEEASEWLIAADAKDIATIFLVAPTSNTSRLDMISSHMKRGFVYSVSRTGVTGARSDVPVDLSDMIGQIRAKTNLPICVGFGVSTGEQVRAVSSLCDGAVIGSRLVDFLGKNSENPEWKSALKTLVAEWKGGTYPQK